MPNCIVYFGFIRLNEQANYLLHPRPTIERWRQKLYVHEQQSLLIPGNSELSKDPNEIKIICLRATGGEVGASSALAPKIGPLGLVSSWSVFPAGC